MQSIIEYLDNAIVSFNKEISDKVTGIYYLEKLKYNLIDGLKKINFQKEIEVLKDNKIQNQYGQIKLLLKVENYKDSISRIRKKKPNDILTIILQGFNSIKIYENIDSRSSKNLNLYKMTGISIPKETVVSESISKDTILVNIFIIEEKIDIEK